MRNFIAATLCGLAALLAADAAGTSVPSGEREILCRFDDSDDCLSLRLPDEVAIASKAANDNPPLKRLGGYPVPKVREDACAEARASRPELVLPPVFAFGEKTLFTGDSITDGKHGADMNHIYGHGYANEIATRYQAFFPDLKLQFANSGTSGNTSADLRGRWSRDAFPYTVNAKGYEGAFGVKSGTKILFDRVSILIGINDYAYALKKHPRGVSAEDYKTNLLALVRASRAANPGVRIVLCEPFRLPTDATPDFCRRQDAVAEVAATAGCDFVPFQKLFSEDLLRVEANPRYWFWDFYHPTPAAHYRMADFWLETLACGTPKNTAIFPRAKLENDSYDWYARHEQIVRDQAKLDPELVFIGDSITHFWQRPDKRRGKSYKLFEERFGKYRPLNMGFGWDRTQNVLWRLAHGEMDGTRPKAVVILIGSNNTAPGRAKAFPANTAEETAEGIVEICRRVREKAPKAKIVLMDLFPRGRRPDDLYRTAVAKVNAALAPRVAALGDQNLVRLAIGEKFLDANGEIPPDLMFDALHPAEKGYRIWADALEPVLADALHPE